MRFAIDFRPYRKVKGRLNKKGASYCEKFSGRNLSSLFDPLVFLGYVVPTFDMHAIYRALVEFWRKSTCLSA